ncbi:MAG TPA: homoserine kinase [Wenzhouxiangellaceae bacterium]|nr:homoserine kinase [Wenzhouxiangellaceae bacterium]HKL52856.1 homoserine kinase [Wenzhouxiangellaceae bacterium]
MNRSFATATAPASVGNAAVGFDLLGHALNAPADCVTASRSAEPGVRIASITGSRHALPLDAESNTASRAVMAMFEAHGIDVGVELTIEKGIPLASGLGGSAASAVAAVVAASALLELDLAPAQLYPFALAGEAVASGATHGDNVGCQLLGGLVLATADRLVSIPVPDGLTAVAVHPDYRVNTRDARQCLAEPFDLATVVAQSCNLALVLTGCHKSSLELIRSGLADVMVEPRRAALIPGFAEVKRAALENGALGASISGAGPTVFGWFADEAAAESAGRAMVKAFADAGLGAEAFVSPVAAPGARIVDNG